MVERYLGVVEAVGSSPATQTIKTTLQASFFSLLAGLEGRGTENSPVGCSTAPPLCPQAGKSRHSDQIKPKTNCFRLYFFAFSGQNRAFSHHFRTTRNSENFLTTYLTTVGAGAIRLVASAPVRSAHEKLNSKGSRRCSPRTFFFVSCVSVFILTFYSSLKNIAFCVIIWLYNFLSHI